MLQVDLHLHTFFSGDSTISPKLIVDQLNAHRSIKGVAITDHNTLEGYYRVCKLVKAYEDLTIVPGIEISTDKGDIIVLGVEEKPTYPVSLNSVRDFAKENGGVVVVPHPYRSLGIADFAMHVDAHAIEILNPTATPKENMLAQKLAKTLHLPGVAGTDAHKAEEMWTVLTQLEAQPNAESVLEAIQHGLVKAVRGAVQQT